MQTKLQFLLHFFLPRACRKAKFSEREREGREEDRGERKAKQIQLQKYVHCRKAKFYKKVKTRIFPIPPRNI